MHNLRRWLVSLRLDETDDSLLAYVAFMAQHLQPEAIQFLYVGSLSHSPISIWPFANQAHAESETEDRKVVMQLAVYRHFAPGLDCSFETVQGQSVSAVLQETVRFSAGLTFLTWDPDSFDSQVLARKVTQKTCSSVWLVPKGFAPRLRTALIPVDYSLYSHRALRIAMELAQKGLLQSLYCQHVFLGASYYEDRIVMDREEALLKSQRIAQGETDLKQYYEAELDEYLATFDPEARYCLQQVDSLDHRREDVYTKVMQFAEEVEPDLLVMGSRGLAGVNAVMLGGGTEQVLAQFSQTPFLCLKRPVENRDLLKLMFP